MLSSCIHGTREPKALLLCQLASKPPKKYFFTQICTTRNNDERKCIQELGSMVSVKEKRYIRNGGAFLLKETVLSLNKTIIPEKGGKKKKQNKT